MKLIKPTIENKNEIIEMIKEFSDNNEEKIFGSSKAHGLSYEEWLEHLNNIQSPTKAMIEKGYVPTIQYVLYDNSVPIGFFTARLELTKELLHAGGHIGYSIRPSKRRMGYASEGLKLLLQEYKNINVDKVMLCCYDTNVSSAKVIINCGGKLDSEIIYDNKVVQKYWIDIK